jgi:hypothetical protein
VQELSVKSAMLENSLPQNLHAYFGFSLPSYNAWFFPSGFLVQEFSVKSDMLENRFPQHLQ